MIGCIYMYLISMREGLILMISQLRFVEFDAHGGLFKREVNEC